MRLFCQSVLLASWWLRRPLRVRTGLKSIPPSRPKPHPESVQGPTIPRDQISLLSPGSLDPGAAEEASPTGSPPIAIRDIAHFHHTHDLSTPLRHVPRESLCIRRYVDPGRRSPQRQANMAEPPGHFGPSMTSRCQNPVCWELPANPSASLTLPLSNFCPNLPRRINNTCNRLILATAKTTIPETCMFPGYARPYNPLPW